jgi:hypothetical protein
MATQSVRIGWRPYVNVVTQVVNAVDADAQAFISAAGITDLTQAAAIGTLVNDLKSYGLWTKMKAFYPMVGGTATSHKWNLKDPRDLDAAYRLTFFGGLTHDSNGVLGNGTNSYAYTNLSQNTMGLNNMSIGWYNMNNVANSVQAKYAIGSSYTQMQFRYFDSFSGAIQRIGGTVNTFTNSSTQKGMYVLARQNSTQALAYKNGTLQNTADQTGVTTQLGNRIIVLFANDNGQGTATAPVVTGYGPWHGNCIYFADGMNSTEVANIYTSIQKFNTTLGRHTGTPYVSDADAVSFLTAAGITDGTQAAAINTLVIDLKAAGVWSKLMAVYPFVGGTATSHKFNLKDPRDLDAAYRLVFNGGWTHTTTGALPNGTTGYANTFLNPFNNLSIDSTHMSYYSRINNNRDSYDMGVTTTNTGVNLSLTTALKWGDSFTYYSIGFNPTEVSTLLTSSARNFIFNKTSSTSTSMFENNVKYTFSVTNRTLPNGDFYLGARNLSGVANSFSNRETAFTSIGDGLTDTEVATFYVAIQKYQTTLGRQVNTPVVSDSDAQTFLNAAGITSYTQANAINTLVTDLKSAGVWTKMKALYPFVGGTATTHKFNLKDPRDVDAAYRLVFNGGWTHTGTGALPNGTTGYANTYLNPYTNLSTNNTHDSIYINNNISSYTYWPGFGVMSSATSAFYTHIKTNGNYYSYIGLEQSTQNGIIYSNDSNHGFYINSRISSTSLKGYKNGITKNSTSVLNTGSLPSNHYYYGVRNMDSATYNNYSHSFASIGDGLTDTESTAFYTAVQKFQTALGRQIGTPIYNTNGLVLNLDAGVANSYPGTGTTWFDLASSNNGTLVNGPTYDINNGGSLSFSTNKYVTIPTGDSYNFGTSDFTIEGWVNFNSISTNQIFVSKFTSWVSNLDFVFRFNFATPRISFIAGDLSAISLQNTYNITTNTWYNYCVSRVSGVTTLYLNGIAQMSHTGSVNIPNDKTDIRLGYAQDNSEPLNGRMSGFKVYNRGLSATEVLQNFNSSRGRFGV